MSIRAGSRHTTTRISTSQVFYFLRRLHQDFYNVYAFCRWADDLGDEIGDPAESLKLLAWWREELYGMYEGRAQHPVFVALEDTAQRYDLPRELFDNLIYAFEQDQTVTRYEDWGGVFRLLYLLRQSSRAFSFAPLRLR